MHSNGRLLFQETSASTMHAIETFHEEQRADSIETKHWLSSIVQSQNESQITINVCESPRVS